MDWLLIITIAITGNPGGGYATIESIALQSEQACDFAKEKYLEANKNMEGLDVTAVCISQTTVYQDRR